MTMRRNVARGAAVALALAGLLAGAPREAQVTTGTIAGTVKDEQGAAVPGATVTITEVNKGTVGTYTTDADGSFQAPFLIPGTYDVAVELAGLPEVHPPRRRAAGEPARARRRDAERGRPHRGHGGGRAGAAHAHRLRGAGGGDRGARGARAAAERAQLRARSSTSFPASPPARPARTSPAPPPSTRAAPRTSTPSARRPTRTPGWSTASTTTSTPSTP